MRALVEAGLRRVIEESKTTKPFQLRDGSVSGQGMRPEVAAGGWDEMLRLIYEGRGG